MKKFLFLLTFMKLHWVNPIPLALVPIDTHSDFSWKYLEMELEKFWLLVFIYKKKFYNFFGFFCMIFMLNKLFCHFLCHLLEVWGWYSWFMAKGLICPQPTLEWLNGWSHNSQLSKIRSDMLKSALWGIFETLDWLLQK